MSNLVWSRREILASTAVAGSLALFAGAARAMPGSQAPRVPFGSDLDPQDDVLWLDGAPPGSHEGQSWGQPWPRGTRLSKRGYVLQGRDGTRQALQTWPLAWWPDGSIKWTGHALAADGGRSKGLRVVPGAASPTEALFVRESGDAITVTAGRIVWTVGRSGDALIRSARAGENEVLQSVRLLASAQDRSDDEEGAAALSHWVGTIDSATVEQSGPIRAVIKLDGRHRAAEDDWLPFSVRLYFHAGSDSVRLVHSMVFDGDPAKRFIRGLGLEGAVPMRDALHDRHVRLAGENGGLWGEAVRPLTGLRRDPGKAFRDAQAAGLPTPPLSEMATPVRQNLDYIPSWGEFRLRQPNSDGFSIVKRTGPGFGWIDVDSAGRAPGLGYVGGVSGGVTFGMHDFWQRCPVGLDIVDAAKDKARFTVWYHAPDAPAMDMRFYHDVMGMESFEAQNSGLDVTYEDYEPGWGDASGIARTTEFRLWALPATPARQRLVEMGATLARPPRLVANVAHVHAAGMFGPWSPIAAGGPQRGRIEARAKQELDFYIGQVEQRRWYGFWNYGDVMHSYDNDRHVWRYDIGGFAWDNSELSTDLWLWYGFLRSGRADVFRLAEAMTRHTGEVDVYHSGRFKGLGTRHGVQHWADSSKQPRISNAAYRRFYYYLTTDERCGDLMRALLHSDEALETVDIGRKVMHRADASKPPAGTGAVVADQPLPKGQVFMQFGTVWGSLIAAWLTEWERTHDPRWRDRIVAGMRSIAAMPKGWLAGGAPFDLASGRFVGGGDSVNMSHLNGVFGVFEITAELLELVDEPAYRKVWLDYCKLYNAPEAEFRARTGASGKGRALTQAHSRYTAYAGAQLHRPDLVKRAWSEFFGSGDREGRDQSHGARTIEGAAVLKPVDEIAEVSTNDAAQWGIAAAVNLTLIGDALE
ncbi:Tat pathway signal sequence domain protein [Novosphingobium resinovorum]|uniref:exo-rhamnogalacturonan lyase family protein n=1 Tax=Novosphingobium resinovorum TaxID=158500 RepID=UPI002ED1EF5D|nr:Tat pathway signal sequence domain protein [Novosphingobium resinovorum]